MLFRAENVSLALRYFEAMFGAAPLSAGTPLLAASLYTPGHLLALAACAAKLLECGAGFQGSTALERPPLPSRPPRPKAPLP